MNKSGKPGVELLHNVLQHMHNTTLSTTLCLTGRNKAIVLSYIAKNNDRLPAMETYEKMFCMFVYRYNRNTRCLKSEKKHKKSAEKIKVNYQLTACNNSASLASINPV